MHTLFCTFNSNSDLCLCSPSSIFETAGRTHRAYSTVEMMSRMELITAIRDMETYVKEVAVRCVVSAQKTESLIRQHEVGTDHPLLIYCNIIAISSTLIIFSTPPKPVCMSATGTSA